MKDTKKPKIRFKEFNDSWEQRKLGDVAPLRGGYAFKSSEYKKDGTPIVRISNILPDGSIGADFACYGDMENDEKFSLRNGDALLAMSGATTGKVSILKCKNTDKYYQNQRVGYFERNIQYNYDFVSTIVRSDLFKEQLMSVLVAGAQPNVSSKEIDSFEFVFPLSIEEQKKIGQYFANLDNLITLHQRECEKLLCFKKSMLEKMFPKNGEKYPEIRFSGFTDSWEQRKFSETAQRESAARKSSTDFPSVEYEDVVSEFGILNKDVRLKETQKTGIIFDGSQVLYGKLRPYLHNWLSPDFSGVAVGDWWVLKPVNVDKIFLFRLIQTKKFDDIANQSSGSKMPRADWNLLSNTEFMVPAEIEEERKIGQYFSELDNLITLHQREVDKLAKLKKSMLEKMFV